ncbi:MAG: hypothetical protein HKN36_07135 [Hellea sp.]|nr:hypothetical protein [Hellea sp.]
MRHILLSITLAGMLSACSSTPDPEIVCTADWISMRADKAAADIYDETGEAVKAVRKVSNAYIDGKNPNMFQLLSLSNALKGLEKELTNGRGINDLKLLARTCDDPKILTYGISRYVDKLELPTRLRQFMESLPEYRALIDKHLQELTI